jgi:uncharacterized protein YecE (DUF72 family)
LSSASAAAAEASAAAASASAAAAAAAAAPSLLLRHAVEVRHDSFCTPAFPALLRKYGIANIYADHATYPEIADVTADFVYARLQTGSDEVETAYDEAALATWAARLKTWAGGGEPADLPKVDPGHVAPKTPRDVFAFIIHEGKVRAPHGARALQALVDI